jgi:hypothetical protein
MRGWKLGMPLNPCRDVSFAVSTSDSTIAQETFLHDYFKLETEVKHRRFERERHTTAAARAALAAGTGAPDWRRLSLDRFVHRPQLSGVMTPAQSLSLEIEKVR